MRAREVEKKWRVRRGLTKGLHHVGNVKRRRRRKGPLPLSQVKYSVALPV
jgi:hypothetical protein